LELRFGAPDIYGLRMAFECVQSDEREAAARLISRAKARMRAVNSEIWCIYMRVPYMCCTHAVPVVFDANLDVPFCTFSMMSLVTGADGGGVNRDATRLEAGSRSVTRIVLIYAGCMSDR
jgi:hypothetical protein